MLESRLLEFAAALPEAVKNANRAGAEAVAAAARARCPVGSPPDDPHPGRLMESIHVEADEPPYTRAFLVVADARGDDGFPYGYVAEHGSVRQGAHPFMHPAAEAMRVAHTNAVRQAIGAIG